MQVLTARLGAPGGALSDADERRPDTARLQKAIDGCAPGKAVELEPEGDRQVFLSGAHPTERDAQTKAPTAADAAAYDARRFLAGGDGWNPTARR